MVNAAKAWDADHPDVEVVFAQGTSGTDDEGEIAAIQSMITQGVKAIAITPTSPNVQAALEKATDAGIKVVLIDNDIPDWAGKTAVVATDNLAGGKLAGTWLKDNLPAGRQARGPEGPTGQPVARGPGDRHARHARDSGHRRRRSPATDCDQTKGLDAATDILTANPDLTAIYAACGPPVIGALEGDQERGHRTPARS